MKADRGALAAANRQLPPHIRLVLLHGPDTAASHDQARQLLRQFADPADPLAVTVLAGGALAGDPGLLGGATQAISMFGGGGAVFVEDAGDDALPSVEALLAAPPGLPVVMTAGVLRKGSKLLALADASPAVLSVVNYALDARGLATLADEMAREIGLQLAGRARAAVIENCGGDRGVLRQELHKLALYVDARPDRPAAADLEAVEALSATLGTADFGALVEAVAGRRADAVAREHDILAGQGVAGIALLRAVLQRFWRLLDLRLTVDGGSSVTGAIDAARPPVFWKDKPGLAAQLGDWSQPALRSMLARLLAAERQIKSAGSVGDVLVRQLLVTTAMRRG